MILMNILSAQRTIDTWRKMKEKKREKKEKMIDENKDIAQEERKARTKNVKY